MNDSVPMPPRPPVVNWVGDATHRWVPYKRLKEGGGGTGYRCANCGIGSKSPRARARCEVF